MSFLVELLVRGAILSGVLLLIAYVPGLRRLSARGTMITIAMAWMVALPALVASGPRVALGVLPTQRDRVAPTVYHFVDVGDPATTPAPLVRDSEAATVASVASSPNAERTGAELVYLIVALGLLLWRGSSAIRVHRLIRRAGAESAPEIAVRCATLAAQRVGLRATPRLCVSSEAPLPFVFGFFHPVIVISPDALTWPASRLEAVMLHEMAHIRRRDILTRGIADVACALNWFNPLVWIAAARVRAEAELACDDAVVRAGIGAEEYARDLVQLARRYNGMPFLSPAIGIAGASSLGRRVHAILATRDRGITWAHVALGAVVACVTAAASAFIAPVPAYGQSLQPLGTLNISSSGPEISSNAAGLQARWNDHGKHSALFLTGDVDFRDVAGGQVHGSGRLLLVEELGDRRGVKVFEWRDGRPEVLPTDVRESLVTGAGQLERLAGRHRGFPGSTLSGLPAWSDDPNANVVQAGWLKGGERYGLASRGKWSASAASLEPKDDDAWLVLFAIDQRRGTVRRLQIQRDESGRSVALFFIDGVPTAYDARAREWALSSFQLLQRIKPPDVNF